MESKLKKQMIGGRIAGELAEKFKLEMESLGVSQTELLEKIVNDYYTPKPTPKPEETEWTIDLLKCNKKTIAAFLEMQDKNKEITNTVILDCFVDFVQQRCGSSEIKYLQMVNEIVK